MVKLIIFDLDGVLIDSKDAHYIALNKALKEEASEYIISRRDHESEYDGLPTAMKLVKLSKKGLPDSLHDIIKAKKQNFTIESLLEYVESNPELIKLFCRLKQEGYQVHVASNSVRETVLQCLKKIGIQSYVDFIASNEDVRHPKPNPEMYLRCMIEAGVGPSETVIVEDSYVGRDAVHKSGARLCPISNPTDVTYERIKLVTELNSPKRKWKDHNLNILVPMAGAGSRFSQAGYTFPKPLIEVQGKPMIHVVVDNICIEAKFIFVVQKDHYEKYSLKHVLNMIAPGCEIVQISGVTEGAACTTLLAKEFIDNESQLLIVNSDQWLDWDSSDFMYLMQNKNIDGGILTFPSTHPKWSYAKVTDNGIITEVREKQPISEHATAGVYYWKRGNDYVKYAEKMIAENVRVNNEFYVCPVYNDAIADGKQIKNYPVKQMMGLGTPEDLDNFLKQGIAV